MRRVLAAGTKFCVGLGQQFVPVRTKQSPQVRQRAQHKYGYEYSGRDYHEQNRENENNEEPIGGAGATWAGTVTAQQLIVAFVRFEPERERVADARKKPDQRIQTKPESRARQRDQLVHHQRYPAKQRLERGAALLFLRREN